MNRDEHITYIRHNLEKIVRDVVSTANLLGKGMEFSAVSGYLLQSLFLQMTGAQEQKMKCICWELATDDLSYRHKRYYSGWTLNQCSTLADKTAVYEDLMSAILFRKPNYKIFNNNLEKETFRNDVLSMMSTIFDNTNIAIYNKQKYESFKDILNNLNTQNIVADNKNIFKKGDKTAPILKVTPDTEVFAIYTLLYNHRNRCAHNTPSYQLNFPHLQDLRNAKYQKYDNIFLFFATLLINGSVTF